MAINYSTTPITSTYSGEVISNLDLTVSSDTPAITITSPNVTIEDVHIHSPGTANADGIDVYGNDATIFNVEVDAPAIPNNGGGTGEDGIYIYGATGTKVSNSTFDNVGSGVYAVQSPNTTLTNIVGTDMQGPFPGGQLVQFNNAANSVLNGFALYNNPQASHSEDDINLYQSANDTVENGIVNGDNSPSGVGVMVDSGSTGAIVKNVDAVNMGDGAFSAYGNSSTFTNVRSFNNIEANQGRGAPASNGLIFYAAGNNDSIQGTYTNPASGNIQAIAGSADKISVSSAPSTTPMTPIVNTFPWSTPAPTPPSVGSTLILNLSEDAYQGDAKFDVSVNGKALDGATSVTALHDQGHTQAFTFIGQFGTDPTVAVSFLNDAYAGTPQTDRNLYVNSICYQGATTAESKELYSNGTVDFKL